MSHRHIFVNLPVRDQPRARTFFAALGWTFDPQFTNDVAACFVLVKDGHQRELMWMDPGQVIAQE